MQQGVAHWTSALGGTEHATTKLGARFHLRALFLRQLDFSIDELNFIVTYLTNETTISEQPWWRGLSHAERLETASRMKMQHLRRGEEHVIWLTSMETPRSYILLYGNAEARPLDVATTPVLTFTEGSVIGNLGAPPRVATAQSASSEPKHMLSSTSEAMGVSDSKWRRIKRETTLRKDIHLYNKIIISGPADYIVLTDSDVRESGSGAADRLQWAKTFGLERFVGCLRQAVFEPGAIIVQEGHQLNSLYLLVEGECRASVERDDTNCPSIGQSDESNPSGIKPPLTTAEAQLRHTRKFRSSDDSQLPVASLGPKSTVGDISLILGIPEPTTVRAVTTVNALTLSQEDFLRETSDRHDPAVAACIEKLQSAAYDTLRFVLERVEIESRSEHCDQRLKIDSLREALRQKQPAVTGDKHSTASPSASAASDTTGSSHQKFERLPPDGRASSAGAQLSRVVSLPSVVLKHAAANSATRRQHFRNQFDTSVAAISSGDVVPLEGSTRMSRQQRKAARAFTNLQHPVAGQSLGGYVQMPSKAKDEEPPVTDQSSRMAPQNDDLLFLFPTMTTRRQLHGKTLPLLPRYRGYDGASAE
ncbi:hypothetical protein PHYPSEUDO_003820 [Phytophthora pseudosyringae]|uniref:Cyclic nucleotide-binding domain-containing protein n=1 Tax=Phytophthora pseudosyringae TaxID=221518 RepID=A0A8T1WEV6_9STRA|nr:hypothetical protein PHYPSEUDO_003820 [Phytophthora pseudosyringae]